MAVAGVVAVARVVGLVGVVAVHSPTEHLVSDTFSLGWPSGFNIPVVVVSSKLCGSGSG